MRFFVVSMGDSEKDTGNHHNFGDFKSSFNWRMKDIAHEHVDESDYYHDKEDRDPKCIHPTTKDANFIQNSNAFLQPVYFRWYYSG
jgi:hypothetical protein